MHVCSVIVVLIGLCLGACAKTRIVQSPPTGADWQRIDMAYVSAVQAANDSGDESWQSGWLGNVWVNYFPRGSAGLCYQWQDLVFNAVAAEARTSPWKVGGVQVNQGTSKEHHAVLVYPAEGGEPVKLGDLVGRQAWVLDPWLRGTADVYVLADWLRARPGEGADAALEELPHPDGRTIR
jgi:hypothetical protein